MSAARRRWVRNVHLRPGVLLDVVEEQVIVQIGLRIKRTLSFIYILLVFIKMLSSSLKLISSFSAFDSVSCDICVKHPRALCICYTWNNGGGVGNDDFMDGVHCARY